jgi:predicted Holliday junction resolvase-like endonuclease
VNGWALFFAIVSLILAVLVAVLTYLVRHSDRSSQVSSSTEAATTRPVDSAELEELRASNSELAASNGSLVRALEDERSQTQLNLTAMAKRAEEEISQRVEAEVARLRTEFAEQKRTDRQRSNMLSRSALLAKIAEHMGPLIPGFPYDLKECRHVGEVFDYLVYEGLESGGEIDVIFLEIKSSATGRVRRVTNPREKALRDAIKDGRVYYKVWQPPNARDLEALTRKAIEALDLPAIGEGENDAASE